MAIDPNAWAAAQKAAAKSIVEDSVEVRAAGTQFYNMNRWTARICFGKIKDGIELGNGLDEWLVRSAVNAANNTRVYNRVVNVAALSDADKKTRRGNRKPKRVRIAGVYHEKWHDKYSCTRDLTFDEVWHPLKERWDSIPDPEKNWPKLVGMVLHWGNLIEDIRIERRGCEDHPGASSVMPDLQDFILHQEGMGVSASEHRGAMVGPMQAIAGAFRDLGLGYKSRLQKEALAMYRDTNPQAWKLVTKGALKPLLDRSINMAADDDLGHWWVAMEVVAILFNASAPPPPTPQPQPQPQKGEEGEGQEGEAGPPSGTPDQPEGDPKDSKDKDNKGPKKTVYKVGDRAILRTGPHAGKTVEVIRAGVPHPDTWVQDLEFRVVED